MRKSFVIVLLLFASVVSAQTSTVRAAGFVDYLSAAEAASAVAGGAVQPLIYTGSSRVPWIQMTITYCTNVCFTDPVTHVGYCTACSIYMPPPIFNFNWHEFTTADWTSGGWCNSLRTPAFRDLSDCAAWRYSSLSMYQRRGIFYTTEGAPVLYYFND